MQRKRTAENVSVARAMVAAGGRVCDVMRAFGISWTAARQWTDPEYYGQHKARAVGWMRKHPHKVAVINRKRRDNMTEADRDKAAAKQRQRYRDNPAVKAKLNELAAKYRLTAQYSIGQKVRLAVLGWSNRTAQVFPAMMQAITGCTRDEFTKYFDGDGVFDHIVPLVAFNLTDPAHVVRANHPSNLRLVPAKVNNQKHAKHDCKDVMALQWSGNPDALTQAASFISRQLANLARRQQSEISAAIPENLAPALPQDELSVTG